VRKKSGISLELAFTTKFETGLPGLGTASGRRRVEVLFIKDRFSNPTKAVIVMLWCEH